MSEAQNSDSDPRPVLASIAAIICAFAGYDYAEWGGALAAAAVAFGGIYMLFTAVVLALRLAVGGVILVVIVVALKNRWDWLSSMF